MNIGQSFAKLIVPIQYSMGSMKFKNHKIYSELTDVRTKYRIIVYKSDFMLNANSNWDFLYRNSINLNSISTRFNLLNKNIDSKYQLNFY